MSDVPKNFDQTKVLDEFSKKFNEIVTKNLDKFGVCYGNDPEIVKLFEEVLGFDTYGVGLGYRTWRITTPEKEKWFKTHVTDNLVMEVKK